MTIRQTKRMKLLLVSMYYYPEPVAGPRDLAVELAKRKHEVVVITGFPNYPGGKLYAGYRRRPWQWETLDGVRILRVPFIFDHSNSAIRRIISFVSFTLSAAFLSIFLVKRPNAIWTYQLGLPGVAIGVIKRAPFVHEVQDLWPEWGQTADMGMKPMLYKILDRQERLIYRYSKAIVTISSGFKNILVKKGVPAEKITIIPNSANEKDFRPVPRDEKLGAQEQLTGCFNVIYAGNLGAAQAVNVVLDTAALMREHQDIHFVIIGDGVERQALMDKATSMGLSNLRFLGSRPQSEIAAYLAFADALLITLSKDPHYEITIPSKTYAYLASGRPIIASAAGDVAALINETQAGIVCLPENPQSLVDAVIKLYNLPARERDKFGENGRNAFLNSYTREILTNTYEKIFLECTRPLSRSNL